jgi:hypothetical protein
VYHSVSADLLNLLHGRVGSGQISTVADFAFERLFARKFRGAKYAIPQPTFRAALLRWALLSSRMTFAEIDAIIKSETDWWVLQDFVQSLEGSRLGRPSFESLMNSALRQAAPDVSRVAASLIFGSSLSVHKPFGTCTWVARVLLRFAGLIPYAGRPPSLIPDVVGYTLKFGAPYNWQKLFGSDHGDAERFLILSKQRYETDIDAFVVSLDSFFDLVLRHIFKHRAKSFSSTYGSYLGTSAPAWLKAEFPTLLPALYKLHQLRVKSFTAHPRYRSGPINKRITHAQFYRVRKELVAGLSELVARLPL